MDFPTRPPPSQESLQRYYIGKDISSVPKPAVVLDVAIIKRHCASMLDAVKALDVGFRAHVKTHKVWTLRFHLHHPDSKVCDD